MTFPRPQVFTPTQLAQEKTLAKLKVAGFTGERWVPARGSRLQTLCLAHRLKLAWRVFRGRYDAVEWEAL